MCPTDDSHCNWDSSLSSLARLLRVSVTPSAPLLLLWLLIWPDNDHLVVKLGATDHRTLSVFCFVVTHTVWKSPGGLGGEDQTGKLIYYRVRLNSLLATSYTVLVAGVQYNSGLAVTLLSRKLHALCISREILFCDPSVFSAEESYLGVTFVLFSP